MFDESEEGPFEVPRGCTNFVAIRKQVPDAPKLYGLQSSGSACVFSSLSSSLLFVDEEVVADRFKD